MAYMGIQPFRYRRDGSLERMGKIIDQRQQWVPSPLRGTAHVRFPQRETAEVGGILAVPPIQNATLHVGPVTAEFGWELRVAAMARRAARAFRRCAVCSWRRREALYADFATEFIPHDIACDVSGVQPMGIAPETAEHLRALKSEWVRGPYLSLSEASGESAVSGEYVVYGQPDAAFAGVTVCHARTRAHVPARNWPLQNWTALVAGLRAAGMTDRVLCIGSPTDALVIPECEDARGLPLHRQMDVLRSAKWAIGPSSGPMHLASLCKCPHVVWCGGGPWERQHVVGRYRSTWNPHGTPVHAEPYASWRPEPGRVLEWATAFAETLGPNYPTGRSA